MSGVAVAGVALERARTVVTDELMWVLSAP
jgi:hypothetical protein